MLLSGVLLVEPRDSRCRSAVASGGAAPGAPAELTAIACARELGARENFRCSGWPVRPRDPCGVSDPKGRGGLPTSPSALRRAAAAAAADRGAPTAAPASAGGAHPPPGRRGAGGSGCCRPHRGRAGTRCSTPATRGGDGCADGRARRPWTAQRRTLPSSGAGSRTRIAGLPRSLRPPRSVGGPGRSPVGPPRGALVSQPDGRRTRPGDRRAL